jgi:hypothetical protein
VVTGTTSGTRTTPGTTSEPTTTVTTGPRAGDPVRSGPATTGGGAVLEVAPSEDEKILMMRSSSAPGTR